MFQGCSQLERFWMLRMTPIFLDSSGGYPRNKMCEAIQNIQTAVEPKKRSTSGSARKCLFYNIFSCTPELRQFSSP